ncbi:cytidylate kinase-like family protein [Sunxiuqinia sp. sy24]|uniref:cytidylate kinase-like family protein n=1 Tax=Sunxiuqinia sp. sy24 TaxID=3461495 RepID=UPI0040452247
MENSLLNYMNKRFGDINPPHRREKQIAGPVITISRQVGCGGVKIARLLAEALNEFVICKKWEVISKEVLHESARQLELDPRKVNRLFTPDEHTTFDEIIEAFNARMYKSDRVILKTVKEVIKGFAVDGCCIIVGRAGHIIAKDIEHSLHVRFEAPLEWRIEEIASRKSISTDDAFKIINETEKKRAAFRKHYTNKKHPEELFDLTINVSKFKEDEVVKLIKSAIELKGITERFRSNISYF